MRKFRTTKRGLILVNVLVFSVIALVITMSLVNWGATLLKRTVQMVNSQQAYEIAESGIDYYRWHLANLPSDYYDGNASSTSPGPYIHPFQDKDGNVLGQFALTITPPATGTSIVTVRSKGTMASTSLSRTIQATFAVPSFAQYAVVSNDNIYFGSGTTIFGPIQSNYGIHFDGIAHNIVASALSQYIDPDLNDGVQRYGVYTTGDPTPPTTPPADANIFLSGRQFPVPVIDFNNITTDLSQLLTIAQNGGSSYTSSGVLGYYILLHTNDTYDIYKVTSLQSLSGTCSNDAVGLSGQTGWGSWSVVNKTIFRSAVPFPSSGVIFVQDNLWIDGAINGARLTIAAGAFPANPSTYKNITINNNLTYTNFNGQDSLGLIAQNNINVGFVSADNLTIDAALVAQNGRAGRYYYSSNCSTPTDPNYPTTSSYRNYYIRSKLSLAGMIASNLRYGFAYTDGTGYQIRNITYDGNLLYSPPPSFPSATNQYSTISWKEVPNQ